MLQRRFLVMVLAFTAYACTAKESDFFAPQPIDGTLLPDVDAPVFSSIRPVAAATVLNSNVLSFTLTDPSGTGTAAPSGIDESTVLATVGSVALTLLNPTPTNYSGTFASLDDGAVNLTLSSKDKAGNTRTATLTFALDRTAPLIGFTAAPLAQDASSADSILMTTTGTIADPSFASAQLTVTQPGADGVCGNTDDVPWPKGNSGGQISENTFDLTGQIQANGSFSASFFAYNPASAGEATTGAYCGNVVALDSARDENGAPKPSRGTRTWRSDVTWSR